MEVENALKEKFQRIFGVKKVSFDQPGESAEQQVLFVEIELSRNKITDGRFRARVNGSAVMVAQNDQIPLGFFSKAIAKAAAADKKDLFFFDFEGNTRRFQNLVQRGFSFVYFFDAQYDPENGSITSVTLTVEESE